MDYAPQTAQFAVREGRQLADAGILVRPHPQRSSSEWGAAELDGKGETISPERVARRAIAEGGIEISGPTTDC